MRIAGAILLMVMAGYPWAILLRPRSLSARLGLATLFGLGLSSYLFMITAMAGVRWSLLVALVSIVLTGSAGILVSRTLPVVSDGEFGEAEQPPAKNLVSLILAIGIALIIALQTVGYGLYSTMARLWEFDFLVNWGLKAQMFFLHSGIDWKFLEAAGYRAIHADYPILIPVLFDILSYFEGAWEDRSIGLVYVAFALAIAAVATKELFAETRSIWFTAIGALCFVQFAFTPWVGLAEGPLIAFGTAGLLGLRRYISEPDPTLIIGASVLLGLGASVKNEGLTLVVAAIVMLFASRPRRWREYWRLWPALAIPAPWLIIRSIRGLRTDLAEGSVAGRIAETLSNPFPLLESLGQYTTGKPWFWLGLGLALLIGVAARKFETFLLGTVSIQLIAFVLAYAASPHDLDWHVKWSWERLVSQVALILAFAAFSMAHAGIERWQSQRRTLS